MSDRPAGGSLFDAAAAEYDAARPSYPDELYAELEARTGPLAGRLVLDCGAGTGIASRQLAARGARVVSLDLGEHWWDAYQSALAAACPSYFEQHLSPDWSHGSISAGGLLTPGGSAMVGWTRQVAIGDWITDDRSKSYVIELAPAAREDLLARLAAIIGQRFPDGQMLVPYTTRLWLARKPG